MKKIIIVMCMVFMLMFSVGFMVTGKNQQQKQDKEFALPENAVEVSPGVFYLGKALDKGKVVEGYAFLIKDNQAKETRKARLPKVSSCYTFLASGAKWKTTEDYIVNAYNGEGLTETFIMRDLADSILKWEDAANDDILGGGTSTNNALEADFNAPDDQNEVYFDDLGASNTIAYAVVWGIFGGRPSNRVLVEWDMVFNDAFTWGDAEFNPALMDFENIATHELGHAVGMGDLYTSECSEQTMYGYASNGETKKRDLNAGDIKGISTLY